MPYKIRKITENDSEHIANIIQTILVNEFHFKPNQKGSVMADKCFWEFGKHYNQDKILTRAYFIVEDGNNKIVGGAGYGEKNDEDKSTFEVQRMFLLKEVRGKGLGAKLLDHLLESAFSCGYEQGYLDTRSEMKVAQLLYLSRGFKYVTSTKDKKPIHYKTADIMMYLSKKDWLETKEKYPL